jgi:hypothetical protein
MKKIILSVPEGSVSHAEALADGFKEVRSYSTVTNGRIVVLEGIPARFAEVVTGNAYYPDYYRSYRPHRPEIA